MSFLKLGHSPPFTISISHPQPDLHLYIEDMFEMLITKSPTLASVGSKLITLIAPNLENMNDDDPKT